MNKQIVFLQEINFKQKKFRPKKLDLKDVSFKEISIQRSDFVFVYLHFCFQESITCIQSCFLPSNFLI